jgi:transcriptional regulator with XRE-family HTH domain
MSRSPKRNYLKAWCKYRRMTQVQLAETVDTTGAVVSLLESSDRRLSDKWVLKLAPALGVSPASLLEIDPWGPTNA